MTLVQDMQNVFRRHHWSTFIWSVNINSGSALLQSVS